MSPLTRSSVTSALRSSEKRENLHASGAIWGRAFCCAEPQGERMCRSNVRSGAGSVCSHGRTLGPRHGLSDAGPVSARSADLRQPTRDSLSQVMRRRRSIPGTIIAGERGGELDTRRAARGPGDCRRRYTIAKGIRMDDKTRKLLQGRRPADTPKHGLGYYATVNEWRTARGFEAESEQGIDSMDIPPDVRQRAEKANITPSA